MVLPQTDKSGQSSDPGHILANGHGIPHLAAAGETSWHGLACFAVEEALRRGAELQTAPERIEPIPTSQYPTPARRPANSRLDTSKLRAALGLTLPDWRVPAARSVEELLRGGL